LVTGFGPWITQTDNNKHGKSNLSNYSSFRGAFVQKFRSITNLFVWHLQRYERKKLLGRM